MVIQPFVSTRGTHHRHQVKRRFQVSRKTLRRLVIVLYMSSSALGGAIVTLLADRYGS